MKKIIAISLALFSLAFSGCNTEQKEKQKIEKLVITAVEALISNDNETYVSSFNLNEEDSNYLRQAMEIHDSISWYTDYPIVRYEIQDISTKYYTSKKTGKEQLKGTAELWIYNNEGSGSYIEWDIYKNDKGQWKIFYDDNAEWVYKKALQEQKDYNEYLERLNASKK